MEKAPANLELITQYFADFTPVQLQQLAALEALIPYLRESEVREEIIRSIAKQDSPLVQVALAELMAKIQEKSSVEELQKIIQSDKTPTDVKNKIKESIKILS